ncbi:MAG: DUF6600 domain-containing protein [Thermoanaerobaculia bacterium]
MIFKRILLQSVLALAVPLASAALPPLPPLPHLPDPPPLPSPRPVDLGFFFDDLASQGDWVQRPSYGWVWSPRDVASDWRPYEEGRWTYTDQGWTWLSDEPFGWATYHYGRWYDDPDLGWSWVPGYEWAPSWVSWQEGSDYVGWAPLPPRGRRAASPYHYVFVPDRYFLSSRPARYAVPRNRVWPVYRRSRACPAYRYAGNRVFVPGVPLGRIQRFQRVPRYRVIDAAPDLRFRGPRIQHDRIAFYRPAVRHVRVAPPPLRPVARRAVVDAGQFRRLRDSRRHPFPPAFGAHRIASLSPPPPVAPRRIARAVPAPPHRPSRMSPSRVIQGPRLPTAPRQPAPKQLRSQRSRPEPRVLRQSHPAPRVRHTQTAPRVRHTAPAPRMRSHGRPTPRPHFRGAPRPQRPQHGRPGPRHRHLA